MWPGLRGAFLGERLPQGRELFFPGDGYLPPMRDTVVTVACSDGVSGRGVCGRIGPAGCPTLPLPMLRPRLCISRQERGHSSPPLPGDAPPMRWRHGFPWQIGFLSPAPPPNFCTSIFSAAMLMRVNRAQLHREHPWHHSPRGAGQNGAGGGRGCSHAWGLCCPGRILWGKLLVPHRAPWR